MPKNVLGTELQPCSIDPMTGFYRDGYCRTCSTDAGLHLLCAEMTDEFLKYSQRKGNDLITPSPQYQFPRLKAGDRWCLCISRWKEAFADGVAPPVVLESTHMPVIEFTSLDDLKAHAADSM